MISILRQQAKDFSILRTGLFALLLCAVLVGCKEKKITQTYQKGEHVSKNGDFTLFDLTGKKYRFRDLKGKVVIIDFWATWCGPCQAEIPHLVSLYGKYRDQGLEILGINLDDRTADEAVVKKFAEEYSIDYPVLKGNGLVASVYQVSKIPTTVIVDRNGHHAFRHVGYALGMEKRLEDEIRSLLR